MKKIYITCIAVFVFALAAFAGGGHQSSRDNRETDIIDRTFFSAWFNPPSSVDSKNIGSVKKDSRGNIQHVQYHDERGRVTGEARKDIFGNIQYRDENGRITGEVRKDIFGNVQYRDGYGRITGEVREDIFGNVTYSGDAADALNKKKDTSRNAISR